ncbi:hypothetical protein FQN49_008346, partial [Arthroderma sp. PD_2]
MEPSRDSEYDQIFLHPTASSRYRGGDSIALSSRNSTAYRRLSSADEPYLSPSEAFGVTSNAAPPAYQDGSSRGFGLGIGQPGTSNRSAGGMGEEADLGYNPSHSRNFSQSSSPLRDGGRGSPPDFSGAYHRPSPSLNSSFQSDGSDHDTARIVLPGDGQEYG